MFASVAQTAPAQLPLPATSAPLYSQSSPPISTSQNLASYDDLPPLRPVFGVSLEDLLKRDGSAIPLIVYQCLQAVDLFGLDVEGIYRLSGSASHVSRLRAMFDNGELIRQEGTPRISRILRLKSSRLDSSRFSRSRELLP